MERIIIHEDDRTSNVEVVSSYDVVYVPGFTSVEATAEEYYHKPTLFTNKYEFQRLIGHEAPTFAAAQEYPVASQEADGFSETAIPASTKMFEALDKDLGYRIALYLLSLGLPVYYEVMNESLEDITVAKMYAGLVERFSAESDDSFDTPGDYAVKFLTSGGYPVFEYGKLVEGSVAMTLMTGMLSVAHSRGDAIALIDHTNNPNRKLTASEDTSVINVLRTQSAGIDKNILEYGAMFTPWYVCSSDKIADAGSDACVPASVAYLSALAVQLRDYSPWEAVSGTTRGKVPNIVKLHTKDLLTNNIADSYQTIPGESIESLGITQMSINPITHIRNAGYCIWGNRTLRNNNDGTKASSSLSLRSAVADIKKVLYEASQATLFEQNTDITWLNFKSKVTPLLDRMEANHILEDYSIVRYMINPEDGTPVPAYKILGAIKIRPINSIEVFDLTVNLENTSVTMAEM